MQAREAGILCHVTSLPGKFGQGTFGASARQFVDNLAAHDFTLWQILPLNPPNEEGSPYQSCSSRAINPAFIDFDELTELGFASVDGVGGSPTELDFDAVAAHRRTALKAASDWFWSGAAPSHLVVEAEQFFESQPWLHKFATFQAISEKLGQKVDWWTWPEPLKTGDPDAIRSFAAPNRVREIETEQFLAFYQWGRLREYACHKGVRIIGDVPIYVAANSADTWADPGQFQLDSRGGPTSVSGVPPDYFAADGQLWGNPLYDWQAMAGDGYLWWADRLRQARDLFDVVRIDHFRGFSRYWSVPSDAKTAVEGEWIDGPGAAVFETTSDAYEGLEIIAEDLGDIDQWVVSLRDGLGFPGMRVIQFAFDGNPENPHAPHNHTKNSVCYLGTHDNQTTIGWLKSLSTDARQFVLKTLGLEPSASDAQALASLRQLTLASHSMYALLTLQDAMGKGNEAIMNRPGEPDGNWRWRLSKTEDYQSKLAALGNDIQASGRC